VNKGRACCQKKREQHSISKRGLRRRTAWGHDFIQGEKGRGKIFRDSKAPQHFVHEKNTAQTKEKKREKLPGQSTRKKEESKAEDGWPNEKQKGF